MAAIHPLSPVSLRVKRLTSLAKEHRLANPAGRAAYCESRLLNEGVSYLRKDVLKRSGGTPISMFKRGTPDEIDAVCVAFMKLAPAALARKWGTQLKRGYPLKVSLDNRIAALTYMRKQAIERRDYLSKLKQYRE